MLCRGEQMQKFSHMEIIRGKQHKVKTGLFLSWQADSNKWWKHMMLIIPSEVQWNTTAILQNGLHDINRPDILERFFRDSLPRTFLMIFELLFPIS